MGGVPSIGKFLHKDFTCVLKGGAICEKNPGAGIFFQKKKRKIPGTGIYRATFLGATRPIKTLTCVLMGGALMVSLGGRGSLL